MRFARTVPTLYWMAVAVFLVGVTLRVLADLAGVDAFETAGQIISIAVWPVAVIAATLDVHRHARAAADTAVAAGPAGPAGSAAGGR